MSAGGVVHKLHPGDVACAGRGERIETLLGSCVAIVLTDPRRTVGAMCHIVHSGRPKPGTPPGGAWAGVALETMFRLLRERSITPERCVAYVYGGGNMFPRRQPPLTLGDDNARWALQTLQGAGIEVLEHDVGGCVYRRLAWTVGPGAPQSVAMPIEDACA